MVHARQHHEGELIAWHLAHIHAFLPWGQSGIPLDQFNPYVVVTPPAKSAERIEAESKMGWSMLAKTLSGQAGADAYHAAKRQQGR